MLPRTMLVLALAGPLGAASPPAQAQALPPPPAGVQITSAYGIQFSVIGATSNRGTSAAEAPLFAPQSFGSVGYEYGIARTELTVGQWFEFVQAYAPYYAGALGDAGFTGLNIYPATSNPRGPYEIAEGTENFPAIMSPRFAARYCNWLENGKRTDQAAFESGVYDTSTFTSGGPLNLPMDQIGHAPNAHFWIPTIDEWIKAVYYDPNKDEGVGGYWTEPNASDTQLVSGLPGTPGAETSGGLLQNEFAVGSYSGTQTPWGLLDVSGGATEVTSSLYSVDDRYYYVLGSPSGSPQYFLYDRLGFAGTSSVNGLQGLRLASDIPSPTSAAIGLAFICIAHRRRIPHGKQVYSASFSSRLTRCSQ